MSAKPVVITDPETGEVRREIAGCDTNDPADLESWYGNFGQHETLRKVVLANCRSIARAKAALVTDAKQTLSDPRADDAARQSDAYIDFIIAGMEGRRLREKNVRESFAR